MMVSVCCITYNHEKFIEQAINGFLMQKTTFRFEVIIHDDASTDGTTDIIKKYEKLFPEIIRPIYQKENQYSKGIKKIATTFVFPCARGKYIAMCEGDDYWTDPYKLQKQVDFLEKNPDYSMCFHDCMILNQNTGIMKARIGNRQIDSDVNLKSLIFENNIPTASMCFRNNLPDRPYLIFKTEKGDYALAIHIAEHGLLHYLPDAMSVYRVHEGGVWSGKSQIYTSSEDLRFYDLLEGYFRDKRPDVLPAIYSKKRWSQYNLALVLLWHKRRVAALKMYLKVLFGRSRLKRVSHLKFAKLLVKSVVQKSTR